MIFQNLSSCYIYFHGTVGSSGASVSPFRIFGTGPCACGLEGFNHFRLFFEKTPGKDQQQIEKTFKNELSVCYKRKNSKFHFPETKLGTIVGKSDPVINIFHGGGQKCQFYRTVSRI